MTEDEQKKAILGTVDDLAGSLLYYDRKDSTEYPLKGDIEVAVENGLVTLDEIVETFRTALVKQGGLG